MVHTVPVRRPPIRPAVLALVAGLLLASCSSTDGRTLPPPDPDRTTTSTSSPGVSSPSDGGGEVIDSFALGSAAFADGDAIPARHTCAGEGLSPALDWALTPPAAELALVVRDQDAAGFVHWVLTGIDPLIQGIGEDGVPEGSVEAANDAGGLGWTPPCPPSGTHTYVFTLHVLPEPLALTPGMPAREAAEMVEGASSAQTALTGTVTAA